MRPRSIVGPLLLIALGALFLANNLRPDFSPLRLLAEYWPYILIGWGVLRLMEVLFWAVRSKPYPGGGVSGGEWTLVIFICLLGSGAFALHRHAPWANFDRISVKGVEVFGQAYDFPVEEQTVKAGKAPRILVENLRGNVRVVGASADEIKVSGRKTIRALEQSAADKANRESPLEVTVQGDQVIVRTNQERVTGDQRISLDLEITVPKGASIEGRGSRSGDFDIADLAGGVQISSDRGDVRLQNVGGKVMLDLRGSEQVRASNVQGSIELQGRGENVEFESIDGETTINGSYSGDLRFRKLSKPFHFVSPKTEFSAAKIPGTMTMDLGNLNGSDLVGPIRLNTASKDVQIENFTGPVNLDVERGDVELRPVKTPVATMDVKTKSGNIGLALPDAARFTLTATTDGGEVTNDFGDKVTVESKGKQSILKTPGTGGSTITAVSEGGSITLRRESDRKMMSKLEDAEDKDEDEKEDSHGLKSNSY